VDVGTVEMIWVFIQIFTSSFDILLVEKVEEVEEVDSLAGFAS